MELVIERLSPLAAQEPIACERIRGPDFGCVWHRHPQYEIALVRSGGSHRWVGDRITALTPGDLVLLGPNLPHDYRNDPKTGAARRARPVDALIVQFSPQLFGSGWLEPASMECLQQLFLRSKIGLRVRGRSRRQAEALLLKMPRKSGVPRMILLLQVLQLLSTSKELEPIASTGFDPAAAPRVSDRLASVMAHIEGNLSRPLYVDALARRAGLSQSAFTRLFKRATLRTVPRYINELRIARACRILAESDDTVSQIADVCGYPSGPYFQRQFRKLQKCSPLEYRHQVRSGSR
jgi:AraC-like DNA-binding protein